MSLLAPLIFVGGVAGIYVYEKRHHEDDGTAGFPLNYFGQQGFPAPTLNLGLNKINLPGSMLINYPSGVQLPEFASKNHKARRKEITAHNTHWSSSPATRKGEFMRLPLNVTFARREGAATTFTPFGLHYSGQTENETYRDPRNYAPPKYRHYPQTEE